MRDYEGRRLPPASKRRFIKETLEIRESNRRRFDQLESYIKREFETVHARFKTERDERLDVASQQSRELKELGESLEPPHPRPRRPQFRRRARSAPAR